LALGGCRAVALRVDLQCAADEEITGILSGDLRKRAVRAPGMRHRGARCGSWGLSDAAAAAVEDLMTGRSFVWERCSISAPFGIWRIRPVAGVRRRFPSLAHRCRHIYNGVDIELFARPPGVRPTPKRILYVGRLAPEKGVHILLDAFRIVITQHPDAHLELIGPERVLPREVLFPACNDQHVLALEPYFQTGAYAELLRAKISQFPSGSISFLNQGVKFIELMPHYHSASIFAFSSVCEESFGMPLIEAMASSTPVVATRGGAFPEIVEDGLSGLLVDRSNAQSLATAILQLLSNPDQREAMAEASFKRASLHFSWDRIAADLVEEYERLVRRGEPG
jgi:glycosyltransferase involved in cell wall biosynthesis